MDDVYEISLLLDFYGQLLTVRQYEILDMHYNNDYSLAEIGAQLEISRQGVYDNVKRAKASLKKLEDKLKLVEKFMIQKRKAEEVMKTLKSLKREGLDSQVNCILDKVESGINDIINNI